MLLNVTGVKYMSPHLLKINEMNPYSTFINISIKTALPKGQQSLSAGRRTGRASGFPLHCNYRNTCDREHWGDPLWKHGVLISPEEQVHCQQATGVHHRKMENSYWWRRGWHFSTRNIFIPKWTYASIIGLVF